MSDTAWAAGLFEGEGCVYLDTYRQKRGTGCAKIGLELATTDEDIAHRFHKAVGHGRVLGPYRNAKSTKPYWTWQCRREADALKVINLLKPWLGERRLATITTTLERLKESQRAYIRRPLGPRPGPAIHSAQTRLG